MDAGQLKAALQSQCVVKDGDMRHGQGCYEHQRAETNATGRDWCVCVSHKTNESHDQDQSNS